MTRDEQIAWSITIENAQKGYPEAREVLINILRNLPKAQVPNYD